MTSERKPQESFSLSRWSKRKLEAARAAEAPPASAAPVAPPPAPAAATAGAATTPSTLPPVASLTADSDFSAFMQPKVDEMLKRAALKKLFSDPHFNIMDGLDVYIDDYSKPDPIPPDMLERLLHSRTTLRLDEPKPVPPPAVPAPTTDPAQLAAASTPPAAESIAAPLPVPDDTTVAK